MKHKSYGFTIVELLIVIVVIAILAAISVVAYSGISNSANDSAIKSDLANFAKRVQVVHAETGNYPVGGALEPASSTATHTGAWTSFPGFNFKPAKAAYFTASGNNLLYCTGAEGGSAGYRIVARSKSGSTFAYSSSGGLQELGGVSVGGAATVCQGIGYPRSWAGGYYSPSNSWFSWTS